MVFTSGEGVNRDTLLLEYSCTYYSKNGIESESEQFFLSTHAVNYHASLPKLLLCKTPALTQKLPNQTRKLSHTSLYAQSDFDGLERYIFLDSLIIPNLLLQNDRVNTSLEQRKHRGCLPLQSSQRIQNLCARTGSKIIEKNRKLLLLSVGRCLRCVLEIVKG